MVLYAEFTRSVVVVLTLILKQIMNSVQSRIKAVNKMDAEAPEPVEVESLWRFSIPSSEPLGRPILAINDVTFDYNTQRPDGTKKKENEFLLQKINFGVDNSSKIAILGANGQVRRISTE